MHRLNEIIANQDIGSAVQSVLDGMVPGEFSNATADGILGMAAVTLILLVEKNPKSSEP